MPPPISQDQVNNDDDDDIIYFKSPKTVDKETGAAATHNPTWPPCDSNHAESPNLSILQLHTLRTIADFALNLSRVYQQLGDSFVNMILSYALQYAVMDIPTDDKESTIPDNDLPSDIANPLIVDDYSVYDEQVNC